MAVGVWSRKARQLPTGSLVFQHALTAALLELGGVI